MVCFVAFLAFGVGFGGNTKAKTGVFIVDGCGFTLSVRKQ